LTLLGCVIAGDLRGGIAVATTDLGELPPEEHTLLTARNAKTLIDHGFTSAYSAASAKLRLDIVIRNAIAAGQIPGPPRYGLDSMCDGTRDYHRPPQSSAVYCQKRAIAAPGIKMGMSSDASAWQPSVQTGAAWGRDAKFTERSRSGSQRSVEACCGRAGGV